MQITAVVTTAASQIQATGALCQQYGLNSSSSAKSKFHFLLRHITLSLMQSTLKQKTVAHILYRQTTRRL